MSIIKKEIGKRKLTCLDIEVALHDNFMSHICVPNVSYGMFSHECDFITLTKSGYCSEFEIKISKSDLKADAKKKHNHIDGRWDRINKIKYLWFAIPDYLIDSIEFIPLNAGIIAVRQTVDWKTGKELLCCDRIREPKKQSDYVFSQTERVKLLELLAHRIWGLKKKLANKGE